jgi:hypothetical protein
LLLAATTLPAAEIQLFNGKDLSALRRNVNG